MTDPVTVHIAAPDEASVSGRGGLHGHPMCGLHLGPIDGPDWPPNHRAVPALRWVEANCPDCQAANLRRQQGDHQ